MGDQLVMKRMMGITPARGFESALSNHQQYAYPSVLPPQGGLNLLFCPPTEIGWVVLPPQGGLNLLGGDTDSIKLSVLPPQGGLNLYTSMVYVLIQYVLPPQGGLILRV